MTRLSKKLVRNALPGSMGVYAIIARKCEVQRSTITRFLRKYPEMIKEIEEEREKVLDVGEVELFKLVKEGNFNAVRMLLMTRGKERGYVERKEIDNLNAESDEELKRLQNIVKEVEGKDEKEETGT